MPAHEYNADVSMRTERMSVGGKTDAQPPADLSDPLITSAEPNPVAHADADLVDEDKGFKPEYEDWTVKVPGILYAVNTGLKNPFKLDGCTQGTHAKNAKLDNDLNDNHQNFTEDSSNGGEV
ncbi:hypothetical protein B0H19DRAFT_1247469 [Mycena capillaripes]|nr:hypothetical protein B0H19DRAFT_1247469 [Mycena capillaripes]